IVDGGLLLNFPLGLLTDPGKDLESVMGKPDPKARVLGLFLDDQKSVPGVPERESFDDASIVQRSSRLIQTMNAAINKDLIEPHADKICAIGVRGYNVLEFDMTAERFGDLVNGGRCAMTAYLKEHRFAFR